MQNNRWRLVWRGVLLSAVLGLVAVLVWGSLEKLNRQKADQEHAKAKEVAVQRQAESAAVTEARKADGDEAGQRVKSDVVEPEMVRLPNGIAMGKYEVTQRQWESVMGNAPSSFPACGDCPVQMVSWNDVQTFIERLNQYTGKHYRLPSENDWKAACQAGGSHPYCGSDHVDSVAWYIDNSGSKPHPLGQKQSNGWGLYDMSGNVSEWTNGCYNGDCAIRVFLGGSWNTLPEFMHSDYIGKGAVKYRYFNLGFRLAQD